MFSTQVYTDRRNKLKKGVKSGIVLLLGNSESPMSYASNTYHYRQDSSFLYFFGLDSPGLAGVLDIDNNEELLFGNDFDLDDIIWMGPQPKLADRAQTVGVSKTKAFDKLYKFIKKARKQGRKVHFLPPYRGDNKILLSKLMDISVDKLAKKVSEKLIKEIVKLREIKDTYEVEEINKAIDTGYQMHVAAMKMAKPGVSEQEIAGFLEGIAAAGGNMVSFPIILSQNGQTLHNHLHNNTLDEGRLMITDAGAESPMHYASDFTRTVPVGGKYSQRQREIYEIVLRANTEVIKHSKPGVLYRDMHLLAAKIIATGLSELGLMKGNIDDAVQNGAHALFMPHGLGHMMGLDVHDMEDFGEDFVGYNKKIKRSDQFGLAYLRLAKELKVGHVITDEPGIYFIPELLANWRADKINADFINYDKVEGYLDFGGIRIEDDLLITEDGCLQMGKKIPKTVEEVEKTMAE